MNRWTQRHFYKDNRFKRTASGNLSTFSDLTTLYKFNIANLTTKKFDVISGGTPLQAELPRGNEQI